MQLYDVGIWVVFMTDEHTHKLIAENKDCAFLLDQGGSQRAFFYQNVDLILCWDLSKEKLQHPKRLGRLAWFIRRSHFLHFNGCKQLGHEPACQ